MTPGTTISHYRIVDQLGRGGMGIVYKAEDTKLDRTVALKLLPPHALVSEDDRARFYREARAAAALNHANIAHIYEIDEAEADNGESRPFIAMEYIDGETLSEVIARGPLPLKDAINYASQIAEGLKVAHEANVVHRDIKSGNIMLTSKGVVKILDFGLAKTAASTKLTQMGSTLGTVAYMSPEQAKGEEVDRRSDIWSAGVILYEMITGQMPFPGDYEQAIVYGILNEDPESMTSLRAGVPMALDGIMAKLLAKDPDLRYQHVDELPADLKAIDLASSAQASRLVTTSIRAAAPLAAEPAPTKWGPRWLIPLVGVGGLAIGLVLATVLTRAPDQPEPQVRRYFAINPEQVEGLNNPKSLVSAYISPDGRRIAFNADSKLWVRSLDNLLAVPVAGSEGAGAGFEWSRDSKSLVFGASAAFRRIVLDNNQVSTLADASGLGWWEFRQDGTIAHLTGLSIRGPVASGVEPKPLTAEVPGLQSNGFAELPDNRGFVVIRIDSLTGGQITHVTSETFKDLAALPAETSAQDLVLTPAGHLIFTLEDESRRRTEVWGVRLDLKTIEVKAGPSMIVSNAKDPSVSADGKLLYMQAGQTDSIEVVTFDRSGREVHKQLSGLVGASAPDISPDRRYVAIDVNTSASERNIWVVDQQLGGYFQLTFDVGNPWRPAWSPDSRRIAFQTRAGLGSEADIYIQSLDSESKSRPLVIGTGSNFYPTWSHDGEWILYTHLDGSNEFSEIWRIRADGTEEPEPILRERFSVAFPSVSPDGRYVAYFSDRSGQGNIFVSSYPDGSRHARVTNQGAGWPKWRGDSIYFIDFETGNLMAAEVTTIPVFRAGQPQMVLTQDQAGAPFSVPGLFLWDVSADESEIVLIRDRAAGSVPQVVVVENWRYATDL